MRLTLRTLLAYLDDVLPPAETKELGKRISESESASDLVARIKEVLRRRRVAAPELGAGPDPNTVAEYLDNLLSSEAVAAHERACLNDDEVLAETAASHQVLALVLGQPITVPEGKRDALYRLAPQAATADHDAAAPVVKPKAGPPPVGEITAEMEAVQRAADGRPVGKMLAAAAALLACLAVFAVVWQSDEALTGGPRPVADAGPVEPLPIDGGAVRVEERPGLDDAFVEMISNPSPEVNTPPAPVDDAAAETPAAVTEVPAEPPAETVETGDAEMPAAAGPDQDAPPAAPAEPPAVEAFAYRFGGDGVLFSRAGEAGWGVVPGGSELAAGTQVVVPPTFTGVVAVSGGPDGGSLELVLGGARAELLPADAEFGGGVALRDGRLAVRNVGEEEAVLRLVAGAANELRLGPGGVALAEVRRPAPPRVGDAAAGPAAVVALVKGFATAGPLGRAEDDPPVVETFGGEAVEPEGLIEWSGSPNDSTLTRRYQTMFEKLLPAEGGVAGVLPAVLNEPIYRMSEMAAETLSLMEDGRSLVLGLSSDHEETRRASIDGLRRWVAADPARLAVLQQELRERYRAETADRLATLVRGFSEEDLRKRSVSMRLLDDLLDEDVAVREAAFAVLRRQVPRNFEYRPNASPPSRNAATRRWRDYVEEQGALRTPVIEEEPVVERPLE